MAQRLRMECLAVFVPGKKEREDDESERKRELGEESGGMPPHFLLFLPYPLGIPFLFLLRPWARGAGHYAKWQGYVR